MINSRTLWLDNCTFVVWSHKWLNLWPRVIRKMYLSKVFVFLFLIGTFQTLNNTDQIPLKHHCLLGKFQKHHKSESTDGIKMTASL